MQFQLTEFLPVTMAALSLPARKKGQDIIHTTDVAFEFEGSNKLLDLFDPALLPMIYRAAENESELKQQTLEGVERVSDFPMLRSAAIKMPMLLALEFAGYTMVVDRGLGETQAGSNIQVDEINVKRIRVWCKEGGSIKGSMHLQSRNVSDAQVGQLRSFLKLQTQLKLIAPQIRQQQVDGVGADIDAELAGKTGKTGKPAAAPAPAPAAAAAKTAAAKKPGKSLKERQADARAAATEAFAGGGTRDKAAA
jgi:hypothetical protein